jgi:hypothetical protein
MSARAGEPLAGGYRFVPTEFKGDWEEHAAMWGCRHYRNVPFFCHRCNAHREARPGPNGYVDDFTGPGWAAVPNHVFLAGAGRVENPLARFLHVDMVKPCYMHTWHMGLQRVANACTIVELLKEGRFQDVKQITGQLKSWCRARRLHLKLNVLTLGKLNWAKHEACPEMKVKSWDNRIVAAWLAEEVQKSSRVDEHQELRAAVLFWLAKLYSLSEGKGLLLTQAEADEIYECGMFALRAYQELSREATDGAGPKFWPLRPKAHWCHHALDDVRRYRLDLGWLETERARDSAKIAQRQNHSKEISQR